MELTALAIELALTNRHTARLEATKRPATIEEVHPVGPSEPTLREHCGAVIETFSLPTTAARNFVDP